MLDFNQPSASTLGLINGIMSAGVIIGLFMTPSMTDRMGRKPTIIFGSLITLFGVALQSGANNSRLYIF
jgi:MFS family permease